jgi:hypothetical protein
MSRPTNRSAARKSGADSRARGRPAADGTADPQRGSRRPNKWFLAATVLMQAVWIGFLMAMALLG